jgi:hypothetical protein
MVMFVPGTFIGQVSAGTVGWAHKGIVRKKFERAIHGRFGKTREFAAGFLIHFSGR